MYKTGALQYAGSKITRVRMRKNGRGREREREKEKNGSEGNIKERIQIQEKN